MKRKKVIKEEALELIRKNKPFYKYSIAHHPTLMDVADALIAKLVFEGKESLFRTITFTEPS